MEAPGPLREVRSWGEAVPDRDVDAGLREAMLLTVGERGYAEATVREVAARVGVSEDRFQRRTGGKGACFARAYAEAAERVAADVLDACEGAEGWREGFRAGLAALLRTVAEQPLLARALLLEARVARGEAWLKHQEIVERLVAALDGAREQPGARAGASPMTAGFVAGAIEESLAIELAAGRGEAVQKLLPDLTHLAFLQLFGEE